VRSLTERHSDFGESLGDLDLIDDRETLRLLLAD
jgi:hypothetical protein